jgi:serine/threonine protein kinase
MFLFLQHGMPVDVYSLSIILYELFSGLEAFPGDILKVYHAKIGGDQPVIPSNFPVNLKEVVSQGCSKEPTQRPSLQEFKTVLEEMLINLPPSEKGLVSTDCTINEIVNTVSTVSTEENQTSEIELEETVSGGTFSNLNYLIIFVGRIKFISVY